MIEESMPPEDIKVGDEVRITAKNVYGWHKVTAKDTSPGFVRAVFDGEPKDLTATVYKVRRWTC